jgi:uncharacterized membrane protein YbaN (DUF454 family)
MTESFYKSQGLPEFKPLSLPVRIFLLALGSVCTGLAVLGVVLPVLPTTPFLLVAVFCYARSSKRCYRWLLRRKFVAQYLEELLIDKGLTAKSKRRIIVTALILMAGAAVIINKPVMYVIFGILMALKIVYFKFGIKTVIRKSER